MAPKSPKPGQTIATGSGESLARIDDAEARVATRMIPVLNPVIVSGAGNETDAELPEGFDDADVAPVGFTPVWKAETPGETLVGTYLGVRDVPIAGRERVPRMYDFASQDGEIVSVWESDVLGTKIGFLAPHVGDLMCMIYLGVSPTKKPGQNAAKLFKVAVKRAARKGQPIEAA